MNLWPFCSTQNWQLLEGFQETAYQIDRNTGHLPTALICIQFVPSKNNLRHWEYLICANLHHYFQWESLYHRKVKKQVTRYYLLIIDHLSTELSSPLFKSLKSLHNVWHKLFHHSYIREKVPSLVLYCPEAWTPV